MDVSSIGQVGGLYNQENGFQVEGVSAGESFAEVLQEKMAPVSDDMDVIFAEAATCYNLPVDLLKAVAKVESNFNPSAVSSAGAMGVMQLMPNTAKGLGVTNPFDAWQNIMGGAKYLRQQLDRFGDLRTALAAYNTGPGNVMKYGGEPSYTQGYVNKVIANMGESAAADFGSLGNYYDVLGNMSGLGSYYNMAGGLNGLGSYYSVLGSLGSYYGMLGNSYGMTGGYSSLGSLGSLGMLGSLGSMGSYSGLSSLLSGGYGLNSMYALSSLMGSGVTGGDGDTVTMDRESYYNLIELMRIQMMMNAEREVGAFSLLS